MNAIRTTLANIGQILLIILFFPVFALICEAFNSTSGITGVIDFLGQIPFCNTIADIISAQFSTNVTQSSLVEITIWTFLKEFPSAFIAGISIHLCVGVFDRFWSDFPQRHKPLPILPGFLGVFLFTIIVDIIGLSENDLTAFFVEIGVIVVMLFGIYMMFRAGWGRRISVKRALLWVIEGLYAVILSVYITGMMLIMEGKEPMNTISFVLILSAIALIGSLLVHFVRWAVERDEA